MASRGGVDDLLGVGIVRCWGSRGLDDLFKDGVKMRGERVASRVDVN